MHLRAIISMNDVLPRSALDQKVDPATGFRRPLELSLEALPISSKALSQLVEIHLALYDAEFRRYRAFGRINGIYNR